MSMSKWADRRPREIEIRCTIDGVERCFTSWTDLSALLAVRMSAGHPTPPRGCEVGECGSCESLLDGERIRLCLLPPTRLEGADLITHADATSHE